jgi:Protein of unknown function (DUF3053)
LPKVADDDYDGPARPRPRRFVVARLSRRAVAFVALIAVAGGLAACGGSEEEQRKAFIQFLQTRIVDKPGIAIPQPTAEEKIAFGRYAADYDVILNFANSADPATAYRKFNYSLPRMDTASNMLARRAENRLAGRRIRAVLKNCYDRAAEAQEARAGLKLPDDLKSVYNAAFEKVITTPVEGLKKIAPIAQKLAKAAADLGDYLYIHPDKVLANGNNFQIADTATHDSLVALTDELNANRKLFFAEQARLQPIFQAGDPLRNP